MTTGRINQVATIRCDEATTCVEATSRFASVCECLNCVLASVSQLSCTTAPLQRLRRAPWELRRRRDSGLSCTSDTRFNLCSKLRRAALVGACNYLLNGRLKQPLIHTTPKQEHRSSRDRMPGTRCKSKKRKANPEVCFSSRCLMSPRSGRPQPERLYKERGEIKI